MFKGLAVSTGLVLLLLALLVSQCGKNEPLEDSRKRKTREDQERWLPVCYAVMIVYNSSCRPEGGASQTSFCKDIKYACIPICSLGMPNGGPGCGF